MVPLVVPALLGAIGSVISLVVAGWAVIRRSREDSSSHEDSSCRKREEVDTTGTTRAPSAPRHAAHIS